MEGDARGQTLPRGVTAVTLSPSTRRVLSTWQRGESREETGRRAKGSPAESRSPFPNLGTAGFTRCSSRAPRPSARPRVRGTRSKGLTCGSARRWRSTRVWEPKSFQRLEEEPPAPTTKLRSRPLVSANCADSAGCGLGSRCLPGQQRDAFPGTRRLERERMGSPVPAELPRRSQDGGDT